MTTEELNDVRPLVQALVDLLEVTELLDNDERHYTKATVATLQAFFEKHTASFPAEYKEFLEHD